MAYIEFLKAGGAHRKGVSRENFIRYFMKFDIFETIFSANLVHFIRRLARFPRVCAQILFKTDFLNFFPPKKGGGARAQEPPPPIYATARMYRFYTFFDFRPRLVKKLCFPMRQSRMQNFSSPS